MSQLNRSDRLLRIISVFIYRFCLSNRMFVSLPIVLLGYAGINSIYTLSGANISLHLYIDAYKQSWLNLLKIDTKCKVH